MRDVIECYYPVCFFITTHALIYVFILYSNKTCYRIFYQSHMFIMLYPIFSFRLIHAIVEKSSKV